MTHKIHYQSCLFCGIHKDSNYFTKFTCAEFLKSKQMNKKHSFLLTTGTCSICGISSHAAIITDLSCEEISKNTNSHKWKVNTNNTFTYCEICKINGINRLGIIIARLIRDLQYNCNEYLMIKANE